MLKNGIYNTVPAILRAVLGAITVPILIRLLGIEEYGLWTLTAAVINILALADVGLSMSTTVFISRDLAAEENSEQLSSTLTIVVGGMLIITTIILFTTWLLAPTLTQFIPNLTNDQSQSVILAFRLSGIVVWSRLMQQSFIGIEQAYQRYDSINIINSIQIIATNFGLIGVSYWGGHIQELMYWSVMISGFSLILHLLVVRRVLQNVQIAMRWNYQKVVAITKFSAMAWVGSIGGVLFGSLDRVIIGSFLGTTALGIYAAITTLTVQINTLSSLPIKPLLPALTQLSHRRQDTKLQIELMIQQALQINVTVALGIGGIFITTAPLLMKLLLNQLYSPQDLITFRVASTLYAIYSINAVGYYVLFSLNEVRIFMFIQVFGSFLSLALIALGAKYGGLLGATWGNIGYCITLLLTTIALKKLAIKRSQLFEWLRFPVIWFVLVSLLTTVVSPSIFNEFSIIIATLEAITLFTWFLTIPSVPTSKIVSAFVHRFALPIR